MLMRKHMLNYRRIILYYNVFTKKLHLRELQ
jgi:hypothetical protein